MIDIASYKRYLFSNTNRIIPSIQQYFMNHRNLGDHVRPIFKVKDLLDYTVRGEATLIFGHEERSGAEILHFCSWVSNDDIQTLRLIPTLFALF